MTFIGLTGLFQRTLTVKANRLRQRIIAGEAVPVLERRWLFAGPPGVGKTELAKEIGLLLADGHHISVEQINGTSVTLDLVRSWCDADQYRPLYGEISVKLVDEVDGVTTAALNMLRTYLDNLAPHRIFIATTNRKADQLQEQLQSRFQVFPFQLVPAAEIAAYLVTKYKLAGDIAQRVANGAGGNVRAAESDAITALDAQAAMAA